MHPLQKATFLVLIFGSTLSAFPQTKVADRIARAIDDRETTQLQGNVHSFLRQAVDQGRMDGGQRLEGVSLLFKRTSEQDAAIEKLLAEQQDPASPNYHKWLTPEEYADRFGLSPGDVNKVITWLQAEGFTINRVARGRTAIFFGGTVSQIETVFRTELHHYLVKGESHFANSVEPAVPTALTEVVSGVHHLDDFRPRPRVRNHAMSPEAKANFKLGGQNVLAPPDFAVIYDLKPSGLDGSGQTIAIVGQSAIYATGSGSSTKYPDIDAFRTLFSLPARTSANFVVTQVPGTGTSTITSGDADESSLDLEWAQAVAPGVKEIFIYAGSSGSAFDAIQYAIDNNSAQIISSSYGLCEPRFTSVQVQSITSLGRQANVQGQTIMAASGDVGPADCDLPRLPAQGGLAVDLPGALPYVTSVGGTEFSGDVGSNASQYWSATALKYIPETTWNDTALENQLDATGGGASSLFSKPSWQVANGVPDDGARDVPDIALAASNDHDPYVYCTGGNTSCSNTLAGGTSFGAPTFAGIVAMLNQKIGATGRQGNVNPMLYSLFATTPTAFHDITTGDNMVPCQSGTPDCPSTLKYGFSAGPGYDQVTGLGTLDVTVLANAWNSGSSAAADFHVFGSVASVSAPGGSTTSTITVDGVNGFNSAVTLTCSAPASASITCSVNPTSVTPSGANNTATAILTISTKATAALEPRAVPVWWSGGGVLFAGVFALGIPARRRRWSAAISLLLAGFLIAAVGCSGSSSSKSNASTGTPTGTYVVTVTGAAGGISHTTNVSVNVQ